MTETQPAAAGDPIAIAQLLTDHKVTYHPVAEQDVCVTCGPLNEKFTASRVGSEARAVAHQAVVLSSRLTAAPPARAETARVDV